MVLPVAQDPHQPGGPAEKGMPRQVGATPEQMVAAAGAERPAAGAGLPAAQPHHRAELLEQLQPTVVVGPAVAHRQVDLEHTRIGRQAQHLPVGHRIHRQDAAEPRRRQIGLRLGRRAIGRQAVGDRLQQKLQGAADQRWQEQLPALGIDLQGEHLARNRLRHVLQRQAKTRRPGGAGELPQLLGQLPRGGQPADRGLLRIDRLSPRLRLRERGAQRHRPRPPQRIERIPQRQRLEGDPQLPPQPLQPGGALLGAGQAAPQSRLAGLRPAHRRPTAGTADQAQGPAGVHLALVALARTEHQRAAGPGPLLQLPGQTPGHLQLGGTIGGHTPLGADRIEGHHRRFAAEGELDAGTLQPLLRRARHGVHPQGS